MDSTISDSSVQVNVVKQKFGMVTDNSKSLMVLDYHKLLKVEITKRQPAGLGALTGALAGF